ncbi:MAG: hypothetical protein IGS38_03755 [Synechococcales cyanobacterium M58_A2018_015]|nr:hypothetical protein [Synechococcales cyanobacterium M58_A2018_015]
MTMHHPAIHYSNPNSVSGRSTQSDRTVSHLQPLVDYWGSSTAAQPVRFLAWLGYLWKALLSVDRDPQIQKRQNRHGELRWHVYDPTTGRRHVFAELEDLYEWLERRYYE